MNAALCMNDSSLRKINLRELMSGGKKVILEHGEKPYLLSITRKGKLILTAADDSKTNTAKSDTTDTNQSTSS